jgi:hypothetical protein
MTTQATTVYKAYSDGFSFSCTNLDELRTWANALNARHNLSGKRLSIWKGTKSNGAIVFPSCKPSKVITFA